MRILPALRRLFPNARIYLTTHSPFARLRRKEAFAEADWQAFLARRAELMKLNEQVQTVVAMAEVPVQRVIDARIAAGREAQA
jgi:hypothetical protein